MTNISKIDDYPDGKLANPPNKERIWSLDLHLKELNSSWLLHH